MEYTEQRFGRSGRNVVSSVAGRLLAVPGCHVIRIRQAHVSRYHLGMATRRELWSTRIQLAKEEGVLRELKRGADIGGLGNASTATARDIEHSEREVEQLRAKLKRLKGRV